MAAINFPDAPTNGQIFESGGMSWTYVAGIGWTLNSAIVEAGSGFTFIADTMPLPVNVGDTWFDSSTGASGGTSWVAVEEGPAGASEKVWVQFAPGTATSAGAAWTTGSSTVGAGGYPSVVNVPNPVEAAWGTAVVNSLNRFVRAAHIPPLDHNENLHPQTGVTFASMAAVIVNNRAGSIGIVSAACGLITGAANAAAIIQASYSPPSGGWFNMSGPAGILYQSGISHQMTVPVSGIVTCTQVGTYQFCLFGSSATDNVAVATGGSGGWAAIIGG